MRRLMRVVVTLLLLLVTFNQFSVARAQTLPQTQPVNQARFDFAIKAEGALLGYGTGRLESPTRMYAVSKLLLGDGEETVEVVIYDGTQYTRVNDETTWTAEELVTPGVDVPAGQLLTPDLAEFPITLIGTEQVDGVATDHYQIWINETETTGYTKIDMWIGQQTRYVQQLNVAFFEAFDSEVAAVE
ncbi:MAG: DUF2092 domain-containing protein, partial [Chloroflexaceae bacterium]|nr:DUF2092 domain-containing protein [Chloroflexaceae bacterium]